MSVAEALRESEAQALGEAGRAHFEAALARLAAGLATLPDKREETAATTLRALWSLAAGRPVSAAAAFDTAPTQLDRAQHAVLEDLIERRLAGVPLAHLSGLQRFMGLDFKVGPQALIPRHETELLGRTALALLEDAIEDESPLVLDVCTGCGNLAAAIAHHAPLARVFASDLATDAVALARLNVAALGLEGRVTLAEGDLLAAFDTPDFVGRVDLLVCNPPYISSGRLPQMAAEIIGHEPQLAFDGGPFGLRVVQRLVQEAPRFLRPGGWLAFEVGLGQAPALARRMTPALGYAQVRTVADEAGAPRVIVACTAA